MTFFYIYNLFTPTSFTCHRSAQVPDTEPGPGALIPWPPLSTALGTSLFTSTLANLWEGLSKGSSEGGLNLIARGSEYLLRWVGKGKDQVSWGVNSWTDFSFEWKVWGVIDRGTGGRWWWVIDSDGGWLIMMVGDWQWWWVTYNDGGWLTMMVGDWQWWWLVGVWQWRWR